LIELTYRLGDCPDGGKLLTPFSKKVASLHD